MDYLALGLEPELAHQLTLRLQRLSLLPRLTLLRLVGRLLNLVDGLLGEVEAQAA